VIDAPPRLVAIRNRIEARLAAILEDERTTWIDLDKSLDEPLGDLQDLVLGGGKRIRPAYCHWGWVMAGGDPAAEPPVHAGCALELLHAFALAHDDVMDGSPTRRGSPTVWRRFITRHDERAWTGEARRFGEAAAVLVGDIAMVLADRTLGTVDSEVRDIWDELRTELNMGQYLDVVGTVSGESTADQARTIIRYKTAGYTVARPLQLGAALAGRTDMRDPLTRHGLPLGTAFQLRDDVLGVYGDPDVTGKPVGEDLRDGKPTVLLAKARNAANRGQASLLDRVGGEMSDEDVAAVQTVLVDTGALAATEAEIDSLFDQAVLAIEALPDLGDARSALRELAHYVVDRES
jgi:geranylgeranyl diphosphate synthase type I